MRTNQKLGGAEFCVFGGFVVKISLGPYLETRLAHSCQCRRCRRLRLPAHTLPCPQLAAFGHNGPWQETEPAPFQLRFFLNPLRAGVALVICPPPLASAPPFPCSFTTQGLKQTPCVMDKKLQKMEKKLAAASGMQVNAFAVR